MQVFINLIILNYLENNFDNKQYQCNGNDFHNLLFFNTLSKKSFAAVNEIIITNRKEIIKLVNDLRSIDNFTVYSNELVDEDFVPMIDNILGLKDKFLPINTTKDGNCLYYSISRILYGNELKNYSIRLALLFIIIEYKSFFLNLLGKTYSLEGKEKAYEDLIYKVSNFYEWGCEFVQIATSILLNRPIYCFSVDKNNVTFCSH